MERLFAGVVVLWSTVGVLPQGMVNFANAAGGLNAPIYDVDGVTRVSTGFVAQLWAGPTANSLSAVSPLVPFGSGIFAGYFFGGAVTLPGVDPGTWAYFQVRVWNAGAGFGSWAEAYSAFSANDPSVRIGYNGSLDGSGSIHMPAGGGPVPAATLFGLTSFHVWSPVIPEPPVMALSVLALVVGVALRICRGKPK
jgi:hypothetical protein